MSGPTPSAAVWRAREAATIGIFGPHLGGNPGWVTSQGEVLRDLLRSAGNDILDASDRPRRLPRAADTLATIGRHGRRLDAAVVAVFSGPGFAMAEFTREALRPFRVPVVLVLHGGNLPDFAAHHPRRVRRLLRSAAVVVAPSPFLAEALRPVWPEIEVIPNALPLKGYPTAARSPARPRLLWMRAFHPIYRPDLALEAFARLRGEIPEACLTMAGQDKGLLVDTKRRAVERRVADGVCFPGFLGPEAKYEAFADHDIFLSTNAIDNAPVSVLEAAASGLVVVGMDAGGLGALLVDGESVLLVAPGDADAMAAAVGRVLGDRTLSARLSIGAERAAQPSSRDGVTRSWLDLLARACRG